MSATGHMTPLATLAPREERAAAHKLKGPAKVLERDLDAGGEVLA
eukprot:CAMPEP_0169474786 /NCGR_PEP_ID=MMETSP1042-20121227/26445_1 /TAXON_ID=464988 /ORGANISM="Hemiselmis andersenii, Strain CCMP1180" /LENGTH=44 /DNA_ID= /DNA_START= /DNA_END= /DNA_ORIENTATION=